MVPAKCIWILATRDLYFSPSDGQECLALSVLAVWTELETSQDSFQYSPQYIRDSTILSNPAFRDRTKLQKKLKMFCFEIVCLQFSSHRRHRQDKTRHLVLSVSAVWT